MYPDEIKHNLFDMNFPRKKKVSMYIWSKKLGQNISETHFLITENLITQTKLVVVTLKQNNSSSIVRNSRVIPEIVAEIMLLNLKSSKKYIVLLNYIFMEDFNFIWLCLNSGSHGQP